MRTKTIIEGFKNSQKFRVIFKGGGSENDIGLYLTIKQMTEQFATTRARAACWEAMSKLAHMQYVAKLHGEQVPSGFTTTIGNTELQIDLV